MRVLVSGASGLIGSALAAALKARGDQVVGLGRGVDAQIRWDPVAGRLNEAALEGMDAVVHLAGENIAGGRWSAARKERIRSSRVEGTRLLCAALARLEQPPQVLACASGIGYYGDRGAEELKEDSAAGKGFLAEVCGAWEGAAEPARTRGIRVAHLRFGMVLSSGGGALARMLLPFRMGVGGRIGSGQQWMSWICLDDAVRAICHVLEQAALRGPINLTSPHPCTNTEFARALGKALRRPAIFPLPAWAARVALGEMAEGLLLSGCRVAPARLLESGFQFAYPELAGALRYLLKKEEP